MAAACSECSQLQSELVRFKLEVITHFGSVFHRFDALLWRFHKQEDAIASLATSFSSLLGGELASVDESQYPTISISTPTVTDETIYFDQTQSSSIGVEQTNGLVNGDEEINLASSSGANATSIGSILPVVIKRELKFDINDQFNDNDEPMLDSVRGAIEADEIVGDESVTISEELGRVEELEDATEVHEFVFGQPSTSSNSKINSSVVVKYGVAKRAIAPHPPPPVSGFDATATSLTDPRLEAVRISEDRAFLAPTIGQVAPKEFNQFLFSRAVDSELVPLRSEHIDFAVPSEFELAMMARDTSVKVFSWKLLCKITRSSDRMGRNFRGVCGKLPLDLNKKNYVICETMRRFPGELTRNQIIINIDTRLRLEFPKRIYNSRFNAH